MSKGLIGQTFGKYQILDRLGAGGMADVYKAYQTGLDRNVAIKIIHEHMIDDDSFVERFRREAQSVAQLRHPHILQVIDFDIQDDTYYMVMEYIRGGDLKKYIVDNGPSKPEFALKTIAQVADALDYAHQKNMIHRDIKPANIMFTDQSHEQAVLTDFGIAKILDASMLTSSGMLVGTPLYMSPESGLGNPADERSDIYGLGIVLYEMLIGEVPFQAETPYGIIMKHISEPLPLRDVHDIELPDFVELVLMRATQKDPDDRYQTAGEFSEALKKAQHEIEGMAGTKIMRERRHATTQKQRKTKPMPQEANKPQKPKRDPNTQKESSVPLTLMAGLVAALLIILGFGAFGFAQQNQALVAAVATQAELPTQVALVPDGNVASENVADEDNTVAATEEVAVNAAPADAVTQENDVPAEEVDQDNDAPPATQVPPEPTQPPPPQTGNDNQPPSNGNSGQPPSGNPPSSSSRGGPPNSNSQSGMPEQPQGSSIAQDAVNNELLSRFGNGFPPNFPPGNPEVGRRIRAVADDPEALYSLALEAIETGNQQFVPPMMARAITLDPQPEYYTLLGYGHMDPNNFVAAEQSFTSAIELDITFFEAYKGRALAYENQGEYRAAASDYQTAIDLQPDDAELYYALANVQFAVQPPPFERIVSNLERAIVLNPDDERYHHALGRAHIDTGDWDSAITAFSTAIDLAPRDASNYYWRAIAHYERGDTDFVLEDLEDAYERGYERDSEYYAIAGDIYLELDDFEEAARNYNQALELEPGYHALYSFLALAMYESGDELDALAIIDEALRKNVDDPELLFLQAEIYIDLDQYEEAQASYEKLQREYGFADDPLIAEQLQYIETELSEDENDEEDD